MSCARGLTIHQDIKDNLGTGLQCTRGLEMQITRRSTCHSGLAPAFNGMRSAIYQDRKPGADSILVGRRTAGERFKRGAQNLRVRSKRTRQLLRQSGFGRHGPGLWGTLGPISASPLQCNPSFWPKRDATGLDRPIATCRRRP